MHNDPAHIAADRVFRHESARLRASLARTLGSAHLDLADDVVQDALVSALHNWRFAGVPDNPGAWLTRVAKRRAIDLIRRGKVEARGG
jgi:predicted RNA polymerase sigma factor